MSDEEQMDSEVFDWALPNEDREAEKNVPKKKRRKAGELSGRQMALKTMEQEGSETWDCRFPPPFGAAVEKMREALIYFSDGNETNFDSESASAMRIYSSRKLGITTSDGRTSVLTNYFKVALLPNDIYKMAMHLVQMYEEGQLIPPSESNQRQRGEISSSSFNFLRGLDPLNNNDQRKIQSYLSEWIDSRVRPSIEVKTLKENETELQRIKLQLNEEKHKVSRKDKEIIQLEKRSHEVEKELATLKKESYKLNKQLEASSEIIEFLKQENKELQEEFKNKEKIPCRLEKRTVVEKETPNSSSPIALKMTHEAQTVELNNLRKKSKDHNKDRSDKHIDSINPKSDPNNIMETNKEIEDDDYEQTKDPEKVEDASSQKIVSQAYNDGNLILQIGDLVAVAYEVHYYLGIIKALDEFPEVEFLKKTGNSYRYQRVHSLESIDSVFIFTKPEHKWISKSLTLEDPAALNVLYNEYREHYFN